LLAPRKEKCLLSREQQQTLKAKRASDYGDRETAPLPMITHKKKNRAAHQEEEKRGAYFLRGGGRREGPPGVDEGGGGGGTRTLNK